MGYYVEDSRYIYDLIYKTVENYFEKGRYVLKELNKFGQHFQINFILKGRRDHIESVYSCHIGCIAYPNATIKIATPLIQD